MLLTPYILANEFKFQMENHGLPIGPLLWNEFYDISKDEMQLIVKCGNAQAIFRIHIPDLELSLDDYSERYILPIVEALKEGIDKGR